MDLKQKIESYLSEAGGNHESLETLEKAFGDFDRAAKTFTSIARRWNIADLNKIHEVVEDFGIELDTLIKKINGKIK